MSQTVIKFGSTDLKKFIEIYRNHECLWDTENVNYKNREARNIALAEFAQEFGVDGFGPKEITNKIKNLRTQYHGERKKIRDSMATGSSTDVYKSKLSWYNLMDSFLRKSSEDGEATLNMYDTSLASLVQVLDESPSSVLKNTTKKTSGYIGSALNNLGNNEKKARLEKKEDELDDFGKYVASSLRILNSENTIHAQDEIQAILSKYKLRNLKQKENNLT